MKKKFMPRIIVFWLSIKLFTGCETVADCIVGINPNLISKELAEGSVGKNYSDSLTFEMEHANNKDYYISDISIEGDLPPGIEKFATYDTITFSGIPTNSGEFNFTVKITVDPYIYNSDGTDDLCGNVSLENYKIIIH